VCVDRESVMLLHFCAATNDENVVLVDEAQGVYWCRVCGTSVPVELMERMNPANLTASVSYAPRASDMVGVGIVRDYTRTAGIRDAASVAREPSMGITVEFPDSLVFVAREDPEQFGRDVMVHTLGRLYSSGKISAGLAAQVLRCTRLEYFQLLAEQGMPAIDHSDSELEHEMQSSREISRQVSDQAARG
jgi:predicted HTH domain antitoxin